MSNNTKTKGQRRAKDRRLQRRREKQSTAKTDQMLGKAASRRYGAGVAK